MQKISKLVLILALMAAPTLSKALEAVGTDPRIRTFIYGDYDVFKVSTTYGYQTVIELDPKEKIQTISLGNPNIFKIIPSQTRIFIKTMQNDQTTNMTIITDKRSYQFELTSVLETPQDMMYLVKFAYPEYMETGAATASKQPERPMDLYSPVNIQGMTGTMPSAPSPSALMNSMPSVNGGGEPLSLQYKASSPSVSVPAVKLPFSYNNTVTNKNIII